MQTPIALSAPIPQGFLQRELRFEFAGAIVAQLTAALDALRAHRPDDAIVCIRAAADIEAKLADLLGLK